MSALAMHPLDQLVLQPYPEYHPEPEPEHAPDGGLGSGDGSGGGQERAPGRSQERARPVVDREREDAWGVSPGAENLGGEPSLDALVSGMWEGLAAHRSVTCPLCGGEIAPLYGAHHHPVGGRCRGCGTALD